MSLPRSSPSSLGIDENALATLVKKFEESFCHSFMIVRHGQVAAEGWWAPYKKDYRHTLFSLTKSFTSTAIGFAVQEGLLTVDDKVMSFFPDKLPCAPCANMLKMRIKDLLTMSTGHSVSPDIGWGAMIVARGSENDHVWNSLTSFVDREPGSIWVYNTFGTFMCGAIIHKVTGLNVFDYLKPRLFDPLEIKDPYCETDSRGLNPGAFGGHLKTEDLAKFGLFLLNRGNWQGRQILSAEWIDEATSGHANNSNHPSGDVEWTSGYGYQFWRCSPSGVYRGDGAAGQFVIVLPKQNMTIAITGGTPGMSQVMNSVWDVLLPMLDKDPSKVPNLMDQFAELHIRPPKGDKQSSRPFATQVYKLAKNCLGLTNIAFDFRSGMSEVTFWKGTKSCKAGVGYDTWIETTTGSDPNGVASFFSELACAGAWNKEEYTLKMIYTRTPFSDTFKIHFDEKGVMMNVERFPPIPSFEPTELIGR